MDVNLKNTEYLSFDPGAATGWAAFDKLGEEINFGTCESIEELVHFLDTFPGKPRVVIYERYRLRKNKALQQSGSEMPASVAIGAIVTHAILWGSDTVKQEPSIKPMAELMSGIKPRGPHSQSHWVDALNHGVYYLVKKKIRKSKGAKEIERRRSSST